MQIRAQAPVIDSISFHHTNQFDPVHTTPSLLEWCARTFLSTQVDILVTGDAVITAHFHGYTIGVYVPVEPATVFC